MPADPRPAGRVRDQALLRKLHIEWTECVLCGDPAYPLTLKRLSLHHLSKHPRDDVRANLVMLCGDGTTGCHGRITAEDPVTRKLLGEYLVSERADVLDYLCEKYGGPNGWRAWLQRRLLTEVLPPR